MPLVAAIPGIIAGVSSAAPAIAGLAGAASSIYGAVNQGSAVNNASQVQQTANNAAIAEQQRQFNVNQGNLQPFLQGGQQALSAQMALLGLGGSQGGSGPGAGAYQGGYSQTPDYASYVQNNPDLLAAYNAEGGRRSMDAFGQEHWANYGQNEFTNGGRDYSPFGSKQALQAQGQAQGQVQSQVQSQPQGQAGTPGANPSAQTQQTAIDALKNGPLFQSVYNTGKDAILANAAATGGLRGGNIQNSLARFSGDTLAQVIQQQIANLGQVAGQGQKAGTDLSTLGQGTAGSVGKLLDQGGAYRAGGIQSSANANGNIANTITSAISNPQLWGALGLGQKTQLSQPAPALGPQYSLPSQSYAPLQLDQSLSLPAW